MVIQNMDIYRACTVHTCTCIHVVPVLHVYVEQAFSAILVFETNLIPIKLVAFNIIYCI